MKKYHLLFSFLFFLNYSLFGQALKYPSIYQCDSFNITRTHYYYSTSSKTQTKESLHYKEVDFIYRFNVLSADSMIILQMVDTNTNGTSYEFTSYNGKYSIDNIKSNLVVYPKSMDTGITTGFKCFEDSIASNYLLFKLYVEKSGVIIFNEVNNNLNIDSLIDTLTHTLPIGDSLIIDEIKCIYKMNTANILVDLRHRLKSDHSANYVTMIDIRTNDIGVLPTMDLLGRNLLKTSKKRKLSSSVHLYRFPNNKR